jgi:hypothetical protein
MTPPSSVNLVTTAFTFPSTPRFVLWAFNRWTIVGDGGNIAVSVDTVGTTAGMHCMSATTGRIGVLPQSWPGNLDIDLAKRPPAAR